MTSLLAFCVTEKFSGGEKYLIDLLGGLRERGWDVALVGCENPELEAACRAREIRYIRSTLGPKLSKATAAALLAGWLARKREFFAIIEHERADVVLLQYKLEQLLWGGRPTVSDFVLLEHGPIPRWVQKLGPLRRRYRASGRAVVARFSASQPASEAFRSWGFDSITLYAGVDERRVEGATSGTSAAREQIDEIIGGRVAGIYAGRLTAEKGVVAAARAIAELRDVVLFVAGEGPAEEELASISASNPNIVFLGSVPDACPFIAALDFGILLTDDPGEGRPLFAVECIALGVPVIGLSGSPAMRALKTEFGKPVHLINERRAVQIADAIRRVERFVPPRLSWDDSAAKFERVVRGAICDGN